ncbi:unnamed protein product [Linum tenue]|uniref:Uncharacterized protein n=1 Tax=Linum tenue TaxID=586396 RepID=A0AAV0PEJ0_9ROSI|nr:unnamed protein product [Linum tenue]
MRVRGGRWNPFPSRNLQVLLALQPVHEAVGRPSPGARKARWVREVGREPGVSTAQQWW